MSPERAKQWDITTDSKNSIKNEGEEALWQDVIRKSLLLTNNQVSHIIEKQSVF
jgi:hypothetical protein